MVNYETSGVPSQAKPHLDMQTVCAYVLGIPSSREVQSKVCSFSEDIRSISVESDLPTGMNNDFDMT